MTELLDDHSMSGDDHLALALTLAATGHPVRAYALATTAHARATDERLRAEWADCLADCCLKLLRYEAGVGYAGQAAAIWQRQNELARLAQSQSRLAEFLAHLGAADAASTAQQALERAQRCGDATALTRAYMVMGLALFMARQVDQAVPFGERAVAIKRQAGLFWPVVFINCAEAIALAGVKAAAMGDRATLERAITRAIGLTREAVAEARDLKDGWTERLALNNIAEYSMYIEDVETATAALAEVAGAPGEPTPRCRAHYLSVQAKVLAAKGQLEAARATFVACLAASGGGIYLEMEVDILEQLSKVLARMGRFEEALQAHQKFHTCAVSLASESAQRLARLAAQEHEIAELRDAAGHAQSLAATLVRSNAELERETERLTRANLEDTLTGLPNRRALEIALANLTAGGHFACAMLDVDHFKQVNDRFSHVVGDAVLRKIGEIFRHLARHDDLLARFGGEEFALLIGSPDMLSARTICERLRGAVADADWQNIQTGLTIKVSIGFAMGSEAMLPELVMELADQRLYAAKEAGRNCVVGP